MTLRGVLTVALVGGLGFGLGCGVGVGIFLLVDRLFDVWPNEPPFQWVGPLLLLTYGCGFVGALLGGWCQWRHARWATRSADSLTHADALRKITRQ